MKQVRNLIFETNSSSTHSLTMVMNDQFEKWKNGELFKGYRDKFYTEEQYENEIAEILKGNPELTREEIEDNSEDYDLPLSYIEFMNRDDYETFVRKFTTPNGDVVVGFGYYG